MVVWWAVVLKPRETSTCFACPFDSQVWVTHENKKSKPKPNSASDEEHSPLANAILGVLGGLADGKKYDQISMSDLHTKGEDTGLICHQQLHSWRGCQRVREASKEKQANGEK